MNRTGTVTGNGKPSRKHRQRAMRIRRNAGWEAFRQRARFPAVCLIFCQNLRKYRRNILILTNVRTYFFTKKWVSRLTIILTDFRIYELGRRYLNMERPLFDSSFEASSWITCQCSASKPLVKAFRSFCYDIL